MVFHDPTAFPSSRCSPIRPSTRTRVHREPSVLRHLKISYFIPSVQVDDRKGVRCHPWQGIGIRELWHVPITRPEHFHPASHRSLHQSQKTPLVTSLSKERLLLKELFCLDHRARVACSGTARAAQNIGEALLFRPWRCSYDSVRVPPLFSARAASRTYNVVFCTCTIPICACGVRTMLPGQWVRITVVHSPCGASSDIVPGPLIHPIASVKCYCGPASLSHDRRAPFEPPRFAPVIRVR